MALSLVWGPIGQADASNPAPFQHVLLISIDGMHALDLSNYVASHPNSTLATLSSTGDTFANASASEPSNAFPGLLSMTTGGSPRTTGVWYDDAYDRSLYPPGSNCSGPVGTRLLWDQSIDFDSTKIDGGGGIDPAELPLHVVNAVCTPVFPHQFVRVNTIFEAVKAAGGVTAWADDHPSYDILNGPSGKGVDDLYTPEISAVAGTVAGTEAYDDLKVQAVLNEIDGKNHAGTGTLPAVPTVFGMNFEAVNVAQQRDGYTDAQGTPSTALAGAFDHVDQSLGKLVAELGTKNLLQSTLIIITAKHGQAPIDPSKRLIVDQNTILTSAGVGIAHATQDDVSLLWLTDQTKCAEAGANLTANSAQTHIASTISCSSALVSGGFGDPLKDPRVPDVIGLPTLGVIYTNPTSTTLAANGGFSDDDTHVPLLVSNPLLAKTTDATTVHTTQIAPTILAQLGLNPNKLQAVVAEGTQVLPIPSTRTLAAKLVTDTDHLGPGTALADKAAAIQAAVNAGQTATACADITDYIGLVNAQAGKKLSRSNATKLRNDATNLAAALGCSVTHARRHASRHHHHH